MKTKKIFRYYIVCILLILPAYSCSDKKASKIQALPSASAGTNTCDCYSTSPLYNVPISFDNSVPGDLPAFNNQSQVDCFAWQEFIALNWPTDSTSGFGDPGDLSFVEWESYMPKDVLFQKDGVPPPPWGTLVNDTYAKMFKNQNLVFNKSKTKLLTFPSKFASRSSLSDLGFEEAAPSGQPNWLGAQNSTNVWYEIMLNKDYYDFVVDHRYYNAEAQHAAVQKGTPINFPKGVYNGATGAIEIKAAWMEVNDSTNTKWNRYKLSKATVLDPTSGKLRETTIALVGLHILHKTTNQPTWVWATFEQIDNVPGSSTPPDGYNFYNDQCKDRRVTLADCTVVTVPCTPNTSPPYYLSDADPVPIQITRTNPIDSVDANPINTMMQNNIKKFYPNSVWQYYQLVDVIWSQSLQPDPQTPIKAPRKLNTASMTSGANIVANTTLESYVQKTNTCFSCHSYSTIAPYPPDSGNDDIFADFSLVISAAKYKTTQNEKPKKDPGEKKTNQK